MKKVLKEQSVTLVIQAIVIIGIAGIAYGKFKTDDERDRETIEQIRIQQEKDQQIITQFKLLEVSHKESKREAESFRADLSEVGGLFVKISDAIHSLDKAGIRQEGKIVSAQGEIEALQKKVHAVKLDVERLKIGASEDKGSIDRIDSSVSEMRDLLSGIRKGSM